MPWGFAAAAIGAVGSIASGVIGADASSSAADTQAASADRATQLQKEMFDKTQANLSPFMDAGKNALPILQNYLGLKGDGTFDPSAPGMAAFRFDPSMMQADPGYQFIQKQGMDAAMNAASRQGGISGNTLRELTRWGQGLGSQDYWNYYNAAYQQHRNQQGDVFNRLNSLTGSGQNAAANLGSFGANFGQSAGSNIIGAGNALAAGQIGGANALAGGINGIGQNFLNFAAMYNNNPRSSSQYGGGGGIDLGTP